MNEDDIDKTELDKVIDEFKTFVINMGTSPWKPFGNVEADDEIDDTLKPILPDTTLFNGNVITWNMTDTIAWPKATIQITDEMLNEYLQNYGEITEQGFTDMPIANTFTYTPGEMTGVKDVSSNDDYYTIVDRASIYVPAVDKESTPGDKDEDTYDGNSNLFDGDQAASFDPAQEPNLVTSLSKASLAYIASVKKKTLKELTSQDVAYLTKTNHYPVIDIDVPCQLIPSSRPGHYHLYINKAIPYIKYMSLLSNLVQAGIVEKGFYQSFTKRGYTAVRPTGKVKPGVYKPVADILVENAELLDENYRLKAEIEELKKRSPVVINKNSFLNAADINVNIK